jgi:hypothetical protein
MSVGLEKSGPLEEPAGLTKRGVKVERTKTLEVFIRRQQ